MGEPMFDAERLDVYRVALEFQGVMHSLQGVPGWLRSQLNRASASIVLNIGEGLGRRTRRDRTQFFTIARGSATECAAIIDILKGRGGLSLEAYRSARTLLIRIVQMLTRLIASLA